MPRFGDAVWLGVMTERRISRSEIRCASAAASLAAGDVVAGVAVFAFPPVVVVAAAVGLGKSSFSI